MKIKLALASHNTENCFQSQTFGMANNPAALKLIDLSKGDILVFYKSKEGFAGIWEIKESFYQENSLIWNDGIYPNRVKIKPIIYLNPNQYVSPKSIVNDLEMVKNPYYWGLAFRNNLSDISSKDYKAIRNKIELSAQL